MSSLVREANRIESRRIMLQTQEGRDTLLMLVTLNTPERFIGDKL